MPAREPPMGDTGYAHPLVQAPENTAMKSEAVYQAWPHAGQVYPQQVMPAQDLSVAHDRLRMVVPADLSAHQTMMPIYSLADPVTTGVPAGSYLPSAHLVGPTGSHLPYLARDTLVGVPLVPRTLIDAYGVREAASAWPHWQQNIQMLSQPDGSVAMPHFALANAISRQPTPTRTTMVEGAVSRVPPAMHESQLQSDTEPLASHPPMLGCELGQGDCTDHQRLDLLAMAVEKQMEQEASSESSQLESESVDADELAHDGSDAEGSGSVAITSRPKRHACPSCGKPCRSPSELRNHISIKHNGFKPWKCTKCHNSYSTKSNMMAHSRRCGLDSAVPKAYPCTAGGCAKSYNHPCDRDDHFHAVHVGQKRHKCAVCGLLCYSMSNRNKHMLRRHPGVDARSTGSMPLLDMLSPVQQTASVPYPAAGVLVGS